MSILIATEVLLQYHENNSFINTFALLCAFLSLLLILYTINIILIAIFESLVMCISLVMTCHLQHW